MERMHLLTICFYTVCAFVILNTQVEGVRGTSVPVLGPKTDSSLSDEWIGPLPGWLWVTTDFGATGDGKTDDTNAIQAALSNATYNTFLYFPPGTYVITRMLNMTSNGYGTVIGHDPLTTIILYNGPKCWDNQTFECVMLYTNGVYSMKFARLTWDANNLMSTCIQNRWDGCVTGYSGDSVHEDEIFKNAQFGVRAGSNHGPYCGNNGATAEWSIVRSQFINLSSAGYSVEDWNALDWFIRQCVFINCNFGATDCYGEGGFHVFENQFFNSTGADVCYGNCEYFSIRDNFSYNSTRFLLRGDGACSMQFAIQRNIVVNPTMNVGWGIIYDGGPEYITFLDNILVGPSNYSGPLYILDSPFVPNGMLLSINNTFGIDGNYSTAVQLSNLMKTTGQVISIGDKVLPPNEVKWTQPTIPGFQPISTRKIFTVPPPSAGINNSVIQDVINEASAYQGQRPIVYIPLGLYQVNESVVFPPNSDIQLLGRERASWWYNERTLISWSGDANHSANQSVILIQGPSKVTIKFLTILGNYLADGIHITNADQEGGRIYVENFNPNAPTDHNIYAEGLDHLHMDFYQLFDSGVSNSYFPGIVSIGGACAAAGAGDFRIAGFGGASGANANTGSLYYVNNGGRLSVTDSWYEGNGNGWLNMSNSESGTFSFSGGNVSPYSHPNPTVTLKGFKGDLLLNDIALGGNILAENIDESSNIMLVSMLLLNTSVEQPNSAGGLNIIMSSNNPDGNSNDLKIHFNDTLLPSIDLEAQTRIIKAFALLRNARRSYAGPADNRPDNITDVRLFRNWEIFCSTALRVTGNLNPNITSCVPPSAVPSASSLTFTLMDSCASLDSIYMTNVIQSVVGSLVQINYACAPNSTTDITVLFTKTISNGEYSDTETALTNNFNIQSMTFISNDSAGVLLVPTNPFFMLVFCLLAFIFSANI